MLTMLIFTTGISQLYSWQRYSTPRLGHSFFVSITSTFSCCQVLLERAVVAILQSHEHRDPCALRWVTHLRGKVVIVNKELGFNCVSICAICFPWLQGLGCIFYIHFVISICKNPCKRKSITSSNESPPYIEVAVFIRYLWNVYQCM